MKARRAAVAGLFYPADRPSLERSVAELLASAPAGDGTPKAIIAPHAGYQYSGPTAAHAYRLLESRRDRIRRVVLIGPAHRVCLRGMALPSVDAFSTPLGDVPVDTEAVGEILGLPRVEVSDEAHANEHSLEVHLPFLQAVLDDFRVVPIVVGACPAPEVERVLETLWGGDETLIVASSDLSHFHNYDEARDIDANTTARIEALETTLDGEEACGAYALNGLLRAASKRNLDIRTLDVRNSGDTAGDRGRVVGYGAYAVA
ncbi:MAG: AmmeMemoRadiSam system protein B [Woeseiaceae bacterium]